MTRSRRRARAASGFGVVLAVAGVAAAVALARRSAEPIRCGAGFHEAGARCCAGRGEPDGDACAASATCPAPLVATASGDCDAPERRVLVPATEVVVGPSDWEAEGRVPPRVVRVGAFAIDAFEVTVGQFNQAVRDTARAARSMTRTEASAYCAARGGRLPSDDEWLAAAAGAAARRYPWGDTGAVCRRAAWGLATGPCARGARGPDTVGAHADGATASGVFDLAGNVAEWVAPDAARPNVAMARGGSWQSALATELRTWARLELGDADAARDARVGFRCAYDGMR